MKTNKLYKYINLLFRIIIGVVAIWFIYVKLKDDFISNLQQIKLHDIDYIFIVIAVLMVILNWGIEAMKWRYAISSVEKITGLKAFRIIMTGVTLGLITPNRIGEIPGRALLLNKNLFKEIVLKTTVSSFSQVIITILIGGIGFALTQNKFNFQINFILLDIILFLLVLATSLLYFKINTLERFFNKIKFFRKKDFFKAVSNFSYKELINILLLSLLRYVIFSIQFWLVLRAFGIQLNFWDEILLIPVCFMFASFIPTILISEIGVRGSVALFIFGIESDMDIQIIMASVLLWLINVALPALFGLINIKDFNLLRRE